MTLPGSAVWIVSAAIATVVCTDASGAPAAQAGRPNFLVILCDDLGYGDPGCYGHPDIRTPHLDKLAGQGLRFTSCYAAAPVCSPSRAGLLTGRNPNRFGVYDWIPAGSAMHMGSGEITIAQLLKKAGYATCQVGKWHCNGLFNSGEQPQPGDHGFQHWFATQNNAAPSHHNPVNFVRNGTQVGPLEGYSCQIVADEAIRWLRKHRHSDKPFFQFICFHEPHEPVDSPPELVAGYETGTQDRAQYYANVTNMDAAVGRLMAALDELDVANNTLVFFTSDNGPETLLRYPRANRSYGSPGPLRGMKLHLYDGGIRVPGIMRWPGWTRPGTVSDEPISSVDLLPTFCALAGVEPPSDRRLDGTSFLPILEERSIKRETPLFWFYASALGGPRVALRDGDYKLCAAWDVPPGEVRRPDAPETARAIKSARLVSFELYNVREDIAEQNDLAARDPQRVRRMAAQASELFAQVQGECPVWPAPTTRPR